MLQGIVIGHATSTIKHPTLTGWRLVIVQPVGVNREPEADPVMAIDKLGAAPGHTVVLNTDGKAARETVGDEKTPVRYWVIGIVDERA